MINTANIINRVAKELIDDGFVYWSKEEHISNMNDAISAILFVKPEATRKTTEIDVKKAQSRVELPADAYTILSVNQVDGIGAQFIAMSELDRLYPDWRNMTDTPSNWTKYDNEDTSFWLFPAPDANAKVEIDYSRFIRVESMNGTLILPDAYEPMIFDYMLYRAYSKGANSESTMARANLHLRSFELLLKGKSNIDVRVRQQIKQQ
jgi:hypothetical protein